MFPKRLAIILAALGFYLVGADTADASIYGQATLISNPPGTPFTVPDALLPAPWRSYQLSVASDSGQIIAGWSANIQTTLHQRWNDTDFDDDPSNNKTLTRPAFDTRGDSHFTPPPGSGSL